MATPAPRLFQDQKLNILYNGTPGGKIDVAKADKKRGLGGRKALNDISNSRMPSALQPRTKNKSTNVVSVEKDSLAAKSKLSKAHEKGKFGGRKALRDLTNSVKPSSRLGQKLNAVAEENVPSCVTEERFMHNHQEYINAQMKAVGVDYFLKSVGLRNDTTAQLSAATNLQPASKKSGSNIKQLEMEEMPEQLFKDQVPQTRKFELPSCYSPACQSPKSPNTPYMKWDDDSYSDLMVIETPKLLYP